MHLHLADLYLRLISDQIAISLKWVLGHLHWFVKSVKNTFSNHV